AGGTTTVSATRFYTGSELLFDTVGPTVGNEVAGRAVGAVLLASLGILAYLWYAFRRVPNAIRYGVCAVIALLHDVLVVVGIFSILGVVLGMEVDALFITAMLTVIGFSVHDTIVVFDRIRENMLKRRFDTFEKVVNYSLIQTLTRSINTSLTVVFTLFALVLFGGGSIRTFVLALLIGIISGTFSSIFNASLLLVVWENREWRNWFGRGRAATGDQVSTRTA
ncbi:MAG TPA: protein translocase subunit SecF, partial [Chloroflexia bacterium]|nr:protein translocase subunit SecF [Chloroflexia bacterium]